MILINFFTYFFAALGVECMIVVAHAMGRTLVVPPQQHLYLLSLKHKDEEDEKEHAQMGFEDFFDIDLLKSHQGILCLYSSSSRAYKAFKLGFNVMTMPDFLKKEGLTGHLKGIKPPNNDANLWGQALWKYLDK